MHCGSVILKPAAWTPAMPPLPHDAHLAAARSPVSGIVLLVLAVGHVLIMHVVGEGVDRVNFGFVALRWQSPFWRSWDWLMLSLALVHGINGLRMISLDYIRRPGLRIAINWFFTIAGLAAFALGSIIVFTFDPCRWPGTAGIHC